MLPKLRSAVTLPIALAAMLMGCEQRPDHIPVVVSAIGDPLPGRTGLRDPAAQQLNFPERVLLAAAAQGLVRFDGQGGIEPGIAERWIVSDNGKSYIFRLRAEKWSDGSPVTAAQVVASLRAVLAENARTPFAPFVAVVDEVVEMTPQVVEVRLKQPRPDLLKLFAQPEFAILRRPTMRGSGPLRADIRAGGMTALRPLPDPQLDSEDAEVDEIEAADTLHLIGERASRALARFVAKESDLILGGTFHDWVMVELAGVAPANQRVDPAVGLFGFAIISDQGFTASAANREALAMAINRHALTGNFREDWAVSETILPAQLDSASAPAAPNWVSLEMSQRLNIASDRVAAWRAKNGGKSPFVRISMPQSPGTRLVWNNVARDFRAIGITPEWVKDGEPADLQLIDEVAPYDSGRWYHVTACRRCPVELAEEITAARDAPTLAERSAYIAKADLAITAAHRYIPIAQPLRWSVVATRLREFRPNSRAWHPLTHLRAQ